MNAHLKIICPLDKHTLPPAIKDYVSKNVFAPTDLLLKINITWL